MFTETTLEQNTMVQPERKTEQQLQEAFERLIEIRYQKALLEQQEESVKNDAMDYLTGVAQTKSGRFVTNNITADVTLAFRPQREYDSETLEKIKKLDAQLNAVEKIGPILRYTPYLVVHILK